MADREKTQTVHIPGTTGRQPGGTNMDGLSTQVLSDSSNTKVGLLTVMDGAGQGETRPVYSGTNQIGRSTDNRIPLDFGDTTISRIQHAVIAYEASSRAFRIFDGGKANPVHVNGEKLANDRALANGDTIKVGMTTLKFTVA